MDEQLQQVFARAKEQLDNKKYRAALGDFTFVLEREKDWPEALFYRGWARFYNLDKLGAADDIARAVELKPELAPLLVDTGIPVRELTKQLNSKACRSIGAGRPQDAVGEVAGALLIEPDYAMAMLTMAEAYVAMEEPIAAMDWLEKAVTAAAEYAGEIDTYDCYAPLRGYPRYQKLIGKEKTIPVEAETLLTQAKEQFATKQYQAALVDCEQFASEAPPVTDKSFYVLEMFVEPGAMREYIRFASGSLQHIEQVMIACIKGGLGFYKLLSYGQHIRLYRFEQGQKVLGLNLLPFILVTVPGQLTASFAETGKPNILDMEGNPLPASIERTVIKKHKRTGASYEMKESISRDKYLSDLLWDYRACAEAKETLFVTPFAEVIGALEGIPLAGGDEAETADGVFVADEVSEEESGTTCSMEEYLSVMRGKSNIEELSEEKCLGGEV